MIATTMARAVIQFMLRLPPELHEALKNWADREDRSLHAQIVHVLKRAVEAEERRD